MIKKKTKEDQFPRYDLVPRAGVESAARGMADGLSKYKKNNWMRSVKDETMRIKWLNHAFAHLLTYSRINEREELDHAIADLMLVAECIEASK